MCILYILIMQCFPNTELFTQRLRDDNRIFERIESISKHVTMLLLLLHTTLPMTFIVLLGHICYILIISHEYTINKVNAWKWVGIEVTVSTEVSTKKCFWNRKAFTLIRKYLYIDIWYMYLFNLYTRTYYIL